jgi:hypothetical protein
MACSGRVRRMLIIAIVAVIAVCEAAGHAQENPYRTVEGWAKLPEGRTWGSTAAVDVDANDHIWVFERCGYVTAFIPDPVETVKGTSAAEGVAADSQGNIYGAEVGPKALKKYVKK